jgi:hypothetical protein
MKMTKASAYQESKKLSKELGVPLGGVWRGTTKKFWEDRANFLRRNFKKRNNQYNIALKKARENREIIDTTLKGTDYDHWRKMVNKLRMRAKRRPKPKNPFLEEIRNFEREREERKIYDLIDGGQFNELLKSKPILDQKQTSALWNKIQSKGRHNMVLVKRNGETQRVALNANTQAYFANLLMYGDEYVNIGGWGSDALDRYVFIELKNIRIEKYEKPKKEFKDKSGAFFTYINNTDIDLTDYQIYTQEQALNIGHREHCLIQALDGTIKKSLINRIKLAFATNSNINRKDLKIIAEMIERDIILYYYNNEENNIRKAHYKTKSNKNPLEIAIYKNHYFKFEITKYSAYSIKNYKELHEEPEFYNIYKKGRRNEHTAKINSLKLIHLLFLGGYFIRGDLSKFEEIHANAEIRNDIYLDRIEEEQRLIEYKPYKAKKRNIYYADCESFVYEPIHKLYLLGYVSDKNDITTILKCPRHTAVRNH